ncbi:MAG TPA: DUF1549 and DUF1553 domain-containing protein [Gemmataceae bacterium]|nr:DUF1549 and DUF1553 domain-containing protein [Gemmataceae bacterium]
MFGSRVSSGLLLLLAATAPALAGKPSADKARDHWSFRPVRQSSVPRVRQRHWPCTPVDVFLLARLEAAGLKPAPQADKRTLLRRVYLDLIGLPPTPEEQQAFLDDSRPDAFARVVDRLLARPEYGERWARHWLDLARYAESNGYERDGAKPNAWRYRDYVISSFNHDKPFDQFAREQIAGDELPGSNAETQIAATFLRLGTWDDEPADPRVDRYDQLDDVLGTTATAFLALTIRCARCHDHKFEPFSQTDYYRLLAVFEPLKRPEIIVSATHRREHERFVGSAEELRAFWRGVGVEASLLAGALLPSLSGQPRFGAAMPLSRMAKVQLPELPQAHIWYEESPQAPETHLFRRGDPKRAAAAVTPGLPAVLVRRTDFQSVRQKDGLKIRPTAHSTGRRRWLADWITRPDNPLTARVIVNRVWMHHFGKGLVSTPNDFGVMGAPPSHPELLDWLASWFMAEGWHLKPLHRLIVLSRAYQTSSALEADAGQGERKLSLFGRWRQRRLEAEAVRDSILAVSGELNPERGGPSVFPPLPQAVLDGQSRPGNGWGKSSPHQAARRSIYVFCKRSLAVPELELLDTPDTTSSCEQRPISTTAPQALTFLNGAFVQEQAASWAARLRREAGAEPAEQVRRVFTLALCRPPRADELRLALDFLSRQQRQIEADAHRLRLSIKPQTARQQALAALCVVLLNTNEFFYVD